MVLVIAMTITMSDFVSVHTRMKARATSRFPHLEKFSLNFSSSSFVIRVNLLHPYKQPCVFMVYHYLFAVFPS